MPADRQIFDCDVHIHEYPPDLAPYIEQPWRRVLQGMEVRERWLDVPGYSPLSAVDPLLGDYPEATPRYLTSQADLRADLAARGVRACLIFTDYWINIAGTQDEPYATAVMQAYNRYLKEHWTDPDQGIYAPLMTVPQNPQASAAEIERYAGDAAFPAVWLPAGSLWPLWGHRQYDPIYAAASAAGLPCVLMHGTLVGTLFPYQLNNYDTALAKQALAQPLGAIATLVHAVTSGTLARFPNLRLVFTEAGVGWLNPVLDWMDLHYPDLRAEVPFLTELPSAYARRQVYATTHRLERPADPSALVAGLRAGVGVEHLLYASNTPHYNADSPDVVANLGLDAAATAGILHDNAARLFSR